MQFFSDGVSEDIIQRLSRGANIKVIAPTSSFQFRGARKAEAAKSLNCSHVLDGSVRRAAQRAAPTSRAPGTWPDCVDEVPYDFRAESTKAQDVPKEEFALRPA